MSTDRLTEDEAVAFGRRLDTFAAGLTSPERTLLSAILRDAEVAPYDAIDRRTPGDIVVAIHRTHRSPPISLNPLPIPPGPPRFTKAQRDRERDVIFSARSGMQRTPISTKE